MTPVLPKQCLSIALLIGLAACGEDCGLFCFQYDLGEPLTLVASVKDAKGNRVPVNSASLRQGADSVGCTIDGSGTIIECDDTVEGPGTLTVQAAGQVLTREVDIGVISRKSCGYTQEIKLRLEGPGCAEPRGNSLEGRLLDAEGEEITGATATAWLYGRQRTCRMTGARFECPSLSPYSATYRLELRFGVSRVERDLFVAAHDCQVDPTDATLNLAETCSLSPLTQPAVSAVVTNADAATTEVRIDIEGDSSFVPCTRVSTEPNPELKFECPALTPTGGGTYRVTVDVGRVAQTKTFEVSDDGCNANTAVSFFYFWNPAQSLARRIGRTDPDTPWKHPRMRAEERANFVWLASPERVDARATRTHS